MSFPKYQGNHHLRGRRAPGNELRKLEKAALNSNDFSDPSANPATPPDNPLPLPAELLLVSTDPNQDNLPVPETRIEIRAQFNSPIDVNSLPATFEQNDGEAQTINLIWLDLGNNLFLGSGNQPDQGGDTNWDGVGGRTFWTIDFSSVTGDVGNISGDTIVTLSQL